MDKPIVCGCTYEEMAAINNGGPQRPYACDYPQGLFFKQFADTLDYHNLGYHELDMLVLEGKLACEYAWEHYDELVARECVHRLYGPYGYRMDAGVPGGPTSKRKHELKKQTRRKDYLIYELDNNYKLIRVISMTDYTKVVLIHHCFECDGTQYGVPFEKEGKELFEFQVNVVRYKEGVPVYYGIVRCENLIADFYEHRQDKKVCGISYVYGRCIKNTVYGYPVDWDSPIGGPASPVEKGTWEGEVLYTDFSQYFK